jgi:hypothetical protein
MSGTISGINYASLFPSSSSSSSASTNILSALYGGSSSSTTGTSDLNPITALKIAQTNQTADIATEEKTPAVQVAIQAFTKAVNSATSVQSLLSDPNFLNVFLTANGLGSQTQYTALASKALSSDPSNTNSLANQLSSTNSSWLSTVQTYNFSADGLKAIQNPKIISTIASGYAEVQWRESLDKQTPGLSNALYFLQNASSLKSVDQVLDISKLSNASYVQSLTDEYLVQQQLSNSSSSSSGGVTSLFA